MAVPRLTARLANSWLLAIGAILALVGMVWLSYIGVGTSYLTGVALPMMLIGAGQGFAFGPLTNAGITDVRPSDAGAASGLLNTAHQLGMALGLGILVAVSAHVDKGIAGSAAAVERASAALTGSSVILALALLVVLLVIVPAERTLRPTADIG
jgi:hypothetical protein